MKVTTVLYHFLRWCPGGLGIFLRQKLYPYLLGKCGVKVLIGRFVTIKNPHNVYIGDKVVINDHVTIELDELAGQPSTVTLDDNVFIGSGSKLHAATGSIKLEEGSSVGSFCTFEASSNIVIGKDVLLAAYCTLGFCPKHVELLPPINTSAKAIDHSTTIEAGSWLGVRSIVLPGALIGEGSIVGAHAVVQSSLPPYVVAVGVPAKVIRNRRDCS